MSNSTAITGVAARCYACADRFESYLKANGSNLRAEALFPLLTGLLDQLARLPAIDIEPYKPIKRVLDAPDEPRRIIAASLGFEGYWDTFASVTPQAEETLFHSVLDDLIDISWDLRWGMDLFEQGQPLQAMYTWRFQFYIHTGEHLPGLIKALYQFLSQKGCSEHTACAPTAIQPEAHYSPAPSRPEYTTSQRALPGSRGNWQLGHAFALAAEPCLAYLYERSDNLEAAKLFPLLARLLHQAAQLPTVQLEDSVPEKTPEPYPETLLPDFHIPGFDGYWATFNVLTAEPEQATFHALVDDLLFIYRELNHGTGLFKQGKSQEAIWSWRTLFYAHWGHHLTGLVRALYELCSQREWLGEDDGDPRED